MRTQKAMPSLGLFLLMLFLAADLIGGEPKNLALTAKVSVSSSTKGHGAFYSYDTTAGDPGPLVNDGNLDTSISFPPNQLSEAWVSLTWPQPETFREVLVRQHLHQKLEQLSLQVRHDGVWQTVRTIRAGDTPMAKLILIALEPQATDSIRLIDFKGEPRLYEIEVYEGPSTPVINISGDAAGHILGIVTDAFGAAPLTRVPVTLTGLAGQRFWKATAITDEHGMFNVEAAAGLRGKVRVMAQVGSDKIEKEIDSGDLPLHLTPPNAAKPGLNLNGAWRFAIDPPENFFSSGYDDSKWNSMEVPAHWVLKGFKTLTGVGGYRRHFQIPEGWDGHRIKLRFDGVYSGAEVWLNGQRVGSHEGGFTPFELDVTEEAKSGDNLLAVRVTENTRSSSLDAMSLYADFNLTGIIRDVSIYCVPAAHIARLHVATLFDPEYRNATLRIDVKLVNESRRRLSSGKLLWELRSPEGQPVSAPFVPLSFSLPPWGELQKTIECRIETPQHWEGEHPRLYRLVARVTESEKTSEEVFRRIGFRQVEIRGTQLLVNGVPVKLRGTCHHDSDPVRGRAVTAEFTRQDLKLIKEANLNALRTSHYPAIESLFDDADEMGVYIEAEAPFCWVNQSHDLRLAPLIVSHTAELLERDRSHPSVIFWSLANESSWGPDFDRSHDFVRNADTTRSIGAGISQDLGIATRHNPITLDLIRQTDGLKSPVIWDESLCIFQGIYGDGPEIWQDPGNRDYYIAPLIPIWKEVLASKVIQGSMIWAWSDDLFQVPGRGPEYGRGLTLAHTSDLVYGEPGKGVVGDAPWGVVDGWRRKKPEFWHVKKLHSPVRVETLQVGVPEVGAPLRLKVQNRYEFTNLSELSVVWDHSGDSGQLHADISPGATGEVTIPVRGPVKSGSTLRVRFLDLTGELVDEEQILIGEETTVAPPSLTPAPFQFREESLLAGEFATLIGSNFELTFEKRGRGIKRLMVDGRQVMYSTPSLHIQPADASMSDLPSPWTWRPGSPIKIEKSNGNVVATAVGKYRDAEGTFVYRVTPTGALDISYDFIYLGPEIRAREIGMELSVPVRMDRLGWKRRGEWSSYPADHIGRNEGSAKAHSGIVPATPPVNSYAEDDTPLGTNDFRSTKRNIKHASIMDANGYGLFIESNGEQHLRAGVEPDRIAVFVNDWFGGTASRAEEWNENYGKGRLLKNGDRLQGTIHLRLMEGNSEKR
ncbi:MAG: glycoside hydrolase family 2 TIM barrel-domain containing protein [Terriglobia bacterium]